MALPFTRAELIKWCLRKLGAPVIEINLDEDQIENRIDEGLTYFRDYHFDGVERIYFKHQISGSRLVAVAAPVGTPFVFDEIIKGATSEAQGHFYDVDGTNIRFKTRVGSFLPGELVTGQTGNATFTISSSPNSISIGDIDRQYIPVPDKVIAITDILPPQTSSIGGNLGGIFDFSYQWALNNMFSLASTDLVTYDVYKMYISTWEFMFRGKKGIRFNRKTDKVYVDLNDFAIDQFVILECWAALDPEEYKEVYSDEIVREYCYNLLKEQWGSNLKKYSGVQMPGGVTLNGQIIYDEAKADLEKLRERIRKEFELPPDMQVG